MENITVKIEQPQSGELVIREGDALPVKEPVKINITGNIKAVGNFLKCRDDNSSLLQQIHSNQAIVLVDRNKMSIRLSNYPNDCYGTEITACLELSDELLKFGINTDKNYDKQALVKLLRFSRLYFDDKEKHSSLLAAYQSFIANANTDIKDEADKRGNKISNFQKKVTTNIPTDFILNVPVFKGMPAMRFRVEICLDVTDGGARFWFESVELNELIISERDRIIDGELALCKDLVIIER